MAQHQLAALNEQLEGELAHQTQRVQNLEAALRAARSEALVRRTSEPLYTPRPRADAVFWREDSPRGRQAKRALHVALSANGAAETRYTRDMVAIMRGVHRGVMSLVDEHLGHERSRRHEDLRRADAGEGRRVWNAVKKEWETLPPKIAKHLRARVGVAFDTMAKRVDDKGKKTATLIGIRPDAPGVLAAIHNARENNIRLIEDAGRAYADDVRDVLTDPENEGLRVEELRDLLLERGSVSLSRASTIAVTGTLKLASSLNEHRQRAAAVTHYVWSSSRDERVAGNPTGLYPKAVPSHWERDGQTFAWDDPPDEDDNDGHPGNNRPNCRCVAIPVTSDEEQGEEPAAPVDQETDEED